MASNPAPLNITDVDDNTVEVDVPGVGTLTIMRVIEQGSDVESLRLLWDGPMESLPTLEPA